MINKLLNDPNYLEIKTTFKEIVIVVASATATIAVGYVALIGTIILTA